MIRKILLLFLFFCQVAFSQRDSIETLQEVVISDVKLRQFSGTHQVIAIADSVLWAGPRSLTEILQQNSVVHFRENGYGMVSSPGFRGTNAQQTAVIWNGINVNSQFTGLVDFNTISGAEFNSVAVRPGGGSVLYGSSAIGGSVHLSSESKFQSGFNNRILIRYGNFNTSEFSYATDYSDEKISIGAAVNRNSSDNDYRLPNGELNQNGHFENMSVDASAAVRLDDRMTIRYMSRYFSADRNFSLINPTDTKNRYRDLNNWNLLELSNTGKRIENRLKVAYLQEEFQFFENADEPEHRSGIAKNTIISDEILYKASSDFTLAFSPSYSATHGQGDDTGDHFREIVSLAMDVRHQVTKKLFYEAGIRKEITSNYKSPLLFSIGASFKPFSFYELKSNFSKNFRVPTFNDLYWYEGGNENLQPETALQAELTNDFKFKNFNFSLTGYYIRLRNMIQWLPGTSTAWNPQNINEVESYGAEILASAKRKWGKSDFALTGTYAYTVSTNQKTGKQLIYVPYHKVTIAADFQRRFFFLHAQLLFNGEMFTRTDNNARYNLEPYKVIDLNGGYFMDKRKKIQTGIGIRNLFDEQYMAMIGRPFPGRNFNIFINLTI
ncbi:MAG: TonB-dependent receptor [Flavobacterium sp.]|nr:MAG: TonB-dependent receptor [Flavobacterium sp.]